MHYGEIYCGSAVVGSLDRRVLAAGARQGYTPVAGEVAAVRVDSVANSMSFVSYLSSNFDAVIQPRVAGFLSSKRYDDGMPVRRGQLLFTIEPDLLSTTMLAAEASLESARAQALEARNNYQRAIPLAEINAISRSQLDQYTAQHKAAEAAVRSAEQSVKNARLNVGYTEIRSPITGIIENSPAHVGDYVGPGTEFPVLTTISNVDTMSVDIAIPMAQYMRYAGARPSLYENRGLLSDIKLTLADGSAYPYPGFYSYTRKDVSNTTGTLILVVKFRNPGQTLKPGQFARVTASIGPALPRVVVPQQSVSQVQNINSVWVVGADSTVHYRRVALGDTFGDMWSVTDGLADGEAVVVSGQQKLHEGMKVVPAKRQ